MKKLFLLFLLLLFPPVLAQKTDFGLKGGLCLARYSVNNFPSSLRPSFYVGGFTQITLPVERCTIATELLLIDNGGTLSDNSLSLIDIMLPVLARYEIFEGVKANGGFFVSYLAFAGTQAYKSANAAGYNAFNAGLAFGGEYSMGKYLSGYFPGFFLETRFSIGLTNRSKIEGTTIKDRSFRIGLGYYF